MMVEKSGECYPKCRENTLNTLINHFMISKTGKKKTKINSKPNFLSSYKFSKAI
jgi:hypothetical protein